MAIIVDVVILFIILLCIFIGYKRGLIKVAFSLLSFIIALIIAFTFNKPVANLIIQNTSIDDNIENTISSHLLVKDNNTNNNSDEPTTNIAIPQILMESAENTVESISKAITEKLIQLVVLLLIFVIARIILHFITFLADLIAKLPILKQFNELGGLIYGVLQGFVIVYTILAIISLIAPIMNLTIVNYIDSSIIGSKLYNNNLLLLLIKC